MESPGPMTNKRRWASLLKRACPLLLIAAVTILLSCGCWPRRGGPRQGDEIIGGPCRYAEIVGVATITGVQDAPEGAYNCRGAVEVLFTFAPNDSSARDRYRFPAWSDIGQRLTVGEGLNPPRKWVEEQGMVEGKQFPCVRSEITRGTCTPVIFKFPGVDMKSWTKWCW